MSNASAPNLEGRHCHDSAKSCKWWEWQTGLLSFEYCFFLNTVLDFMGIYYDIVIIFLCYFL